MCSPVFVQERFRHTVTVALSSTLRYDAARRAIPPYDSDHRGASAVYSPANDLLRFAEFHLGTRRKALANFLADSSLRRMQRVATPPAATTGG